MTEPLRFLQVRLAALQLLFSESPIHPGRQQRQPRTMSVTDAIPVAPTMEMLTACDRSTGVLAGVKLAAAMPV